MYKYLPAIYYTLNTGDNCIVNKSPHSTAGGICGEKNAEAIVEASSVRIKTMNLDDGVSQSRQLVTDVGAHTTCSMHFPRTQVNSVLNAKSIQAAFWENNNISQRSDSCRPWSCTSVYF